MLQACKVNTKEDLRQILELQRQNLRGVHPATIEKEQGFVTVTHNLAILEHMHRSEPSIIVKDGDVVAAYALTMTKECSNLVPELFSLFAGLSKFSYQGKPIQDYQFYVMGQVCVAADYRGQGVFDMLYEKHKEVFSSKYDFVMTDIATRNTRSLRAHARVGFKTIDTYTDELDEWTVVVWDWQ